MSMLGARKPKKWIQGAVKHPGSETLRAKEHGRSLHEQEEVDSHSKNKHIRGKGLLGLRFAGKHGGI